MFPRVNLVDKVWKARPAKPQGEVFYLDLKFTGEALACVFAILLLTRDCVGRTAAEKLEDLRSWIRSQRPPAPPIITSRTRKTSTGTLPKDKDLKSGEEKPSETAKALPPKPPMAPARIDPDQKGRLDSLVTQVATFVSSLASIAWLLNIRGNDVQFNPVVTCYLFVTTKQAILFVDKAKINADIAAYLKEQGVSIREYADVWTFLRRAEWGDGKVCPV